jgi:hypothetical protein
MTLNLRGDIPVFQVLADDPAKEFEQRSVTVAGDAVL